MIYVALVLVIIILAVLLGFSASQTIKVNEKMDALNEQIDESIWLLDQSYQSIDRAAKTPVLSDEPFVKKVMSDIATARHAVVLVMNKLGVFDQEEATDEDEEGQE